MCVSELCVGVERPSRPTLTDDEERAGDVRIGTLGSPRSSSFGPATFSAFQDSSRKKISNGLLADSAVETGQAPASWLIPLCVSALKPATLRRKGAIHQPETRLTPRIALSGAGPEASSLRLKRGPG